MSYLIALYYHFRRLSPQHRSREAWIEYQKSKGLKGDGSPL